MGKKKYSKRQIIIYLFVFTGIIAFGIFIDNKKKENQIDEINKGYFKVYGIVEKLKPHSSRSGSYRKRKDVVYLYYERNDTIFHIIEDLSDGQIEKLGIKQNDCFFVRVAKSDIDVFDIDFTIKLDTLIDKNNFENQIYKTNIHKSIIE